jgi:hypothetical protein
MQIKTTITFHLNPIRMATSRAITTTNAGKLVGMQISTTTMKSSLEIPQKDKDRVAI